MFDRLWARFDQVRAEARAKAQSPLAAALEEFFASGPFKASIAALIEASFEDGRTAERKRVAEILQAPGAGHFPEIAADLVLGTATGEQALMVLARAEADAATRARPSLPEIGGRVLH
jgi:hypothetical protein